MKNTISSNQLIFVVIAIVMLLALAIWLIVIASKIIKQKKLFDELSKSRKRRNRRNGSGVFMKWSENGELMKGNEKTGMQLSPVKTDAYRNASIVLFLYLN